MVPCRSWLGGQWSVRLRCARVVPPGRVDRALLPLRGRAATGSPRCLTALGTLVGNGETHPLTSSEFVRSHTTEHQAATVELQTRNDCLDESGAIDENHAIAPLHSARSDLPRDDRIGSIGQREDLLDKHLEGLAVHAAILPDDAGVGAASRSEGEPYLHFWAVPR